MSTSHLKRSIELLESDYELNHGEEKRPGPKKNQRKSLSLRKRNKKQPIWNTNTSFNKLNASNDHTEENLSFLNLLSTRHVDDLTADKILMRAGKKKTEETCMPKDEKTVFTEEDFVNFEKEYFVRDK